MSNDGAVTTSPRTTDAAHRGALRLEPWEIASQMRDLLGAKLLAFAVNVDPRTVNRWAAGSDRPRDSHEARLRAAYQAYLLMKPVEADPTIRAWFMGMNPQLDDRSPAEALADDQFREVMSAARAFVAGG